MAQTESKSCNKCNSLRIVTIKKKRIWGRSYEIARPILENKGMRAIFQKKSKKRQNI